MKAFWKKKQKRRGKGLSPEAKSRAQQAKTEAYLANVWLKTLKQDPALAQRIAEQKFGAEVSISNDNEGGYERPDLLEVLRQAKEAKDLIKDELGTPEKGSWVKDLVEILKVMPQAIETFKLMQSMQAQGAYRIRQPRSPEPHKLQQPHQEPVQPPKLEAKMATLLPLLELDPQQAWEELVKRGEEGWITYLQSTSYEELHSNLEKLTEHPEYGQYVASFLEEQSAWLQDLVDIAHKSDRR